MKKAFRFENLKDNENTHTFEKEAYIPFDTLFIIIGQIDYCM